MSFSAAKNCHNLCAVLRKCLAPEGPNLDLLIERTVSVRCVDDEEKMFISTKIDGVSRHYSRLKHEPLKNTLSRMHISLCNPIHKKKFRKRADHELESGGTITSPKHQYPEDINLQVMTLQGNKHEAIDVETSNIEAWMKGNILVIGEKQFRIEVNAPVVLSANLPCSVMSGFPIVPYLELEFANREDSMFMWLRTPGVQVTQSKEKMKKNNKENPAEDCCKNNQTWEFLSNRFIYTPTNNDVGYRLKFVCIPKRDNIVGFSHEETANVTVEASPGLCLFDERHLYTSTRLTDKNQFRVVSYNILADIYCGTEFAQKNLYPYCSKYATEFGYRGQLILKELIGYNSDIICLQECDQKVFDYFLCPALKSEGFLGHYMRKAGEMPEGEALFYNLQKFSLLCEANVIVSEAVNLPCNKHLLSSLERYPALLQSLKKRTAIGQIVALRDNLENGRVLCILNTHLYFRPEATNIRLLQMAVLINCVADLVKNVKSENNNTATDCKIDKLAVLICGDMNSTPDKAVVELLLNGFIPADHGVWKSQNPVEESTNIDLEHDFKLFSACGFPEFTNYVVGFKDTLDYILPDSLQLKVDSFVPFPNKEVVSLHTALPSVVAPSDHLALVCNLSWKD
eukprot:gene5934-6620_t